MIYWPWSDGVLTQDAQRIVVEGLSAGGARFEVVWFVSYTGVVRACVCACPGPHVGVGESLKTCGRMPCGEVVVIWTTGTGRQQREMRHLSYHLLLRLT